MKFKTLILTATIVGFAAAGAAATANDDLLGTVSLKEGEEKPASAKSPVPAMASRGIVPTVANGGGGPAPASKSVPVDKLAVTAERKPAPAQAPTAAAPPPQRPAPSAAVEHAADLAPVAPELQIEEPVAVPDPPLPQPTRTVKPVRLSPSEVAYQAQEARSLREIRILRMQAEAMELRRKIQEQSAVDQPALPPVEVGPLASVLDLPEEPPVRLISVWGTAGDLKADVLSNGMRISVKPGDPLPEGWSVAEVTRGSIVVRRGGKQTVVKIGG